MALIARWPKYSLGGFFSDAASRMDQAFFIAVSVTLFVLSITSLEAFAAVDSKDTLNLLSAK
jgi:hypothetical protein